MPDTISIDLRMINDSGIGTYLRNIVPAVIEGFPEIEFNLLGEPSKLSRYEWTQGKNVKVIDCQFPIYSVKEQLRLFRKIPKETSLFWSPHYNIPLFYRKKMLVNVYDVFHLAMPELVGGLHKQLYAKLMFKAVRRKARAIVTISHFTKRELIRFTGKGRQMIYPIPLGVHDSWFKIKKMDSPHEKPFLLYVGNVKPHKNLRTLIRAFGLLVDKIPHDLMIVGKKEGFITQDGLAISDAAKLGGRIHFTGYLKDEILRQYFVHASAFVFPSFYEGFGLPPLEAMAAGCPVIVSNIAALSEVCGDAALYCDPQRYEDVAEKILALINDNGLIDSLRHKGIERARQFTWGKCVDETCCVIKRLLMNKDHLVSTT